jgi:universal stress protein A
MDHYRHILVALDLAAETDYIVEAAMRAKSPDAKVSLIHVVEPLVLGYGPDASGSAAAVTAKIEADSIANAKQRLADIGRDQDIAEENQHLLQGHPARAIHHVAQEEDVDLIVVGSHGRHGFGLLLGSTANGVLHGATCDVLAVRLPA